MLDGFGGGVAWAHFHRQRIAQQLAGHLPDGIGKGGGEQQGLALFRQCAEQLVQLAGKTQVEHAVGFIQHQGLQLGELHRVLPIQVEQSPRRGHQHVDALAQLHHLRVDADPAVHRIAGQGQVLAVAQKALQHLLGQLASRRQHQRAHAVAGDLRAFQGQALQQRQGETSGFAGAGLRRGHQITALEHGRDGLALYRGRGLVVEISKGMQQRLDQTEGGEGHGATESERK